MFPTLEVKRSTAAQQFGTPSAALLTACRTALAARVAAAALRPLINAMQEQVLREHDFQVDQYWVDAHGFSGGRITDPQVTYEMGEERFAEYYAHCAVKYRAAGYEFPKGHCPLAIAEDEWHQAEVAFGLACKELRIPLDPQEALYSGVWGEFLARMFQIVGAFLPE